MTFYFPSSFAPSVRLTFNTPDRKNSNPALILKIELFHGFSRRIKPISKFRITPKT
ncbi:hypothetical protein LEP1GSC040_3840 [Leptospira santarosai str. 2000030832]|nr:hypothetical protein LEP1GSC040_3840 [Leptospira santarosai str. 2000030832]